MTLNLTPGLKEDADGGQVTARAFLLCREIRAALWARSENMDWNSPPSSPSAVRRWKRRTLLKQGMSRKSRAWSTGWGQSQKKKRWTGERSTAGDSESSREKREPAASSHRKPKVKWAEKTIAVREAGMMVNEKRATWYKSCKETTEREEKGIGSVRRPQRTHGGIPEHEGRIRKRLQR